MLPGFVCPKNDPALGKVTYCVSGSGGSGRALGTNQTFSWAWPDTAGFRAKYFIRSRIYVKIPINSFASSRINSSIQNRIPI